MKSCTFYIEKLLYKHNCVTIPKFGAFITNKKSAELTEDNLFLPPQKQISFNGSLTQNDGLFITYISQYEGVSYQEAQNYVENTVEYWWQQLHEKKEISFENIGFFTLNEDNKLIFEPTTKQNFLTDSFGLDAFSVKETQKEAFSPIKITIPDENKTEKSISLIKYAAVILVGLAVISYGLYPQWNNFFNSNNSNGITQKKIYTASVFNNSDKEKKIEKVISENLKEIKNIEKTTISVSDSSKNQPKETLKTEKIKEAEKMPIISEKTEIITPQKVKISPKIHLIAGAFSTEENAKTMLTQLQKQGFSSANIVGKNARGLFLVAFGSFVNNTDAQLLKKDLRTKNLDTWELIK